MTYDQLVTLEAIVKEGSFKAAAKVLNKTQPSLSASIKKLEEEFQTQIFSRENYRPRLTDKGKAFYNKAAPALESFQELETYGKELGLDYETEISLSLDAICPLKKISPALESFFSPQVTTSLNLHIDVLEGLTERVLEHQVDFAIGSYIEPHEGIEAVRLFDSLMIPVVSRSFYEQPQADLRQLKKLPQIIVKSSSKKSSQKIVGALSGSKQWFTSD
ncbi:MAG: LysR family transcriptional regulator, partial [Bacteriovoracaceae bacterium]